MKKDLSKSYREVNIILDLIGDEYKNQLPKKMKELFNKSEDKSYSPDLTIDDFLNGKYLEDTKIILSILNINYWSSSEEKNEYMKTLRALDEKYKEEHKLVLHEIFPGEDRFKNLKPIESDKQFVDNNNKDNIIKKILDKIKSIIKK